jgi:plasmid maintenance system antidote protein VapI
MQLTLEDRPLSLGETLEARFKENGIKMEMLSFAIKEDKAFLEKIINGKESLTPSLALKLSVFFETTPDYWYRVEYKFDLYRQRNNKVFVDQTLRNITPISQGYKEFDPYKYENDHIHKPFYLNGSIYNSL